MKNISCVLVVCMFHYNRHTGILRWRVNVGTRARAGDIAGHRFPDGYVRIGINGVLYYAHRLAWVYCCGYLSEDVEIDHWDGIRDYNCFSNLRCCGDRADNSHNLRRAHFDNKTGLLGVYQTSRSSKFYSQITVRGEKHYLGSFGTAESAHAAHVKAKRRLHKFNTL